jgi:hypothetical protein
MRRIYLTFDGFGAIAVLAAGGIATALNQSAGTRAPAQFFVSAAVGASALSLAARISNLLERPRIDRVHVRHPR